MKEDMHIENTQILYLISARGCNEWAFWSQVQKSEGRMLLTVVKSEDHSETINFWWVIALLQVSD